MPLWDRLRKVAMPANLATSLEQLGVLQQIEAVRKQGQDPRQSESIGQRLALLWQAQTAAYPSPTAAEAAFVLLRDLTAALREQTPRIPETPEARYTAVAAALGRCIQANIPELSLTDEPSTLDYFRNALLMVLQLRAPELHGPCCNLLLAINATLMREREGNRRPALESLRLGLYSCLAALPPDAMPQFWEHLRSQSRSEEFWPVVRRLRDRRAVPFLLEALPVLEPDGQSALLSALKAMGDARALPALQALAEGNSLVAPVAREALTHILRTSRDDAAQLLRPTDARHAGNPRETLLRPAAATTGTTTGPDELLRPGSAPEEKG